VVMRPTIRPPGEAHHIAARSALSCRIQARSRQPSSRRSERLTVTRSRGGVTRALLGLRARLSGWRNLRRRRSGAVPGLQRRRNPAQRSDRQIRVADPRAHEAGAAVALAAGMACTFDAGRCHPQPSPRRAGDRAHLDDRRLGFSYRWPDRAVLVVHEPKADRDNARTVSPTCAVRRCAPGGRSRDGGFKECLQHP
jgi:hypothetical protein